MTLKFYLPSLLVYLGTAAVSVEISAQCANRMLDFDGIDDYVEAVSPVSGMSDLTLELWYKSDATGSAGVCDNTSLADFRWLVSWDDDGLGLGDCNGNLQLVYQPACASATSLCSTLPAVNIHDGQWHHIALVQDAAGSTLTIYSDCVLLASFNPGNYDLTGFFRLGSSGTGAQGLPWKGQMDEFRLWNTARSLSDIAAHCRCPLSGDETGLLAYWTMDQGGPGADNSSFSVLGDESGHNNTGILQQFSLGVPPGPVSNFFMSGAPLMSPYIGVIDLEIKDYPLTTTLVSNICDGDPVHFCLLCDGQSAGVFSNAAVVWEYNDGAGWQDVNDPHFQGYCFVVPQSVIQASCGINVNGFVDRKYRARFDAVNANPPYNCTLYSKEYDLRICCPLGTGTVSLTTNFPGDLLCEGDNVHFEATLQSSDLFVQTPGPATTIQWYYNSLPIGTPNQLTVQHDVTVTSAGVCFNAKVTHCSMKTSTYSICLPVDKPPHCGLIHGITTPSPLMPDPSDPDPLDDDLYYLICPGSDAVLGMVDPLGFTDCRAVWQYSFDQTTWVDLGSTNDIQNTNILPSYYWPGGQTVIYYRIAGFPLHWPDSGCDPDYSNLITVHVQSAPAGGIVTGTTPICDGSQTVLQFDQPQPGYTYQWYCNGLPVGTNSDQFSASKSACYWVEVGNGCKETYETPKFCLEVCKIKPVISCPLPPNVGACKGQPIVLSGCDSFDTCGGTLSYSFSASNGGPPIVSLANICEMTHTPDPAGTTYTLLVTNIDTGCTNSTSVTIVPCDPN